VIALTEPANKLSFEICPVVEIPGTQEASLREANEILDRALLVARTRGAESRDHPILRHQIRITGFGLLHAWVGSSLSEGATPPIQLRRCRSGLEARGEPPRVPTRDRIRALLGTEVARVPTRDPRKGAGEGWWLGSFGHGAALLGGSLADRSQVVMSRPATSSSHCELIEHDLPLGGHIRAFARSTLIRARATGPSWRRRDSHGPEVAAPRR